ncbi:MAG: hypothetical protein QGI88_00570 [SAR202 cluster bacterium]|nr:hypothetical protein [SAR202 cluster bacterium]
MGIPGPTCIQFLQSVYLRSAKAAERKYADHGGEFRQAVSGHAEGQVVWEYINPHYHEDPDGNPTNAVFRSAHYLREDIPQLSR